MHDCPWIVETHTGWLHPPFTTGHWVRETMASLVKAGLTTLGRALRETGQALDRVGLEALGSDSFKELCESRTCALFL